MGFNSTLVIMNDCLGDIKKDPKFGKKVSDAISKIGCFPSKTVDISSGPCVNAATVVDCHHADGTSLIAVGGNYATVLTPYVGRDHHTDDAKEKILREWADQMGFRLVKKR